MNRYPRNPWAPAIAFAAVAATAVTMGVAVVLPAKMHVQPAAEAVLAKREARPAEVTVIVERIDVVASRPVAADRSTTVIPTALVATKQPG